MRMNFRPGPIVAATHDRDAVGRTILATAAGVAVAGVLIARISGSGFAIPAGPLPEIRGAGHTLVVPVGHGQCQLDLLIGTARFRGALADSGANGYLTLGRNHARQAGIDLAQVRFNQTYESANGRGRGGETRVPWVRIGNFFELRDVPVAVTEIDQPQVLIGIQILRALNFRVQGDRCELGAPA